MVVSSAGLGPRKRLFWQGQEATVQVNYRPILSSDVKHQETRNCQTEKKNLVISSREDPDTKTHRLIDRRSQLKLQLVVTSAFVLPKQV
jgi:hypothetical protein